MMIVLRPTYTMRVEISDRVCGGAFDSLGDKTGCDEILARVKKAVTDEFKGEGTAIVSVFFERFEHRA